MAKTNPAGPYQQASLSAALAPAKPATAPEVPAKARLVRMMGLEPVGGGMWVRHEVTLDVVSGKVVAHKALPPEMELAAIGLAQNDMLAWAQGWVGR